MKLLLFYTVVPKPIAFEVDFNDGQAKAAAKPKRIQVLASV
jgi:hypothetical protein